MDHFHDWKTPERINGPNFWPPEWEWKYCTSCGEHRRLTDNG